MQIESRTPRKTKLDIRNRLSKNTRNPEKRNWPKTRLWSLWHRRNYTETSAFLWRTKTKSKLKLKQESEAVTNQDFFVLWWLSTFKTSILWLGICLLAWLLSARIVKLENFVWLKQCASTPDFRWSLAALDQSPSRYCTGLGKGDAGVLIPYRYHSTLNHLARKQALAVRGFLRLLFVTRSKEVAF